MDSRLDRYSEPRKRSSRVAMLEAQRQAEEEDKRARRLEMEEAKRAENIRLRTLRTRVDRPSGTRPLPSRSARRGSSDGGVDGEGGLYEERQEDELSELDTSRDQSRNDEEGEEAAQSAAGGNAQEQMPEGEPGDEEVMVTAAAAATTTAPAQEDGGNYDGDQRDGIYAATAAAAAAPKETAATRAEPAADALPAWSCPRCTLVNSGYHGLCQGCDMERVFT
jgi:hypothetical protein